MDTITKERNEYGDKHAGAGPPFTISALHEETIARLPASQSRVLFAGTKLMRRDGDLC